MKIVCISDTHEKHREVDLPGGDVLIHAGDFTFAGGLKPTMDFLDWFESRPFKHKIFVCGNHDFFFEQGRKVSLLEGRGFHYLMNSGVRLEERITLWGSPFTPEFMNWAFMERREKIGSIWEQIPGDLDVLITHGPPFGILDRTLSGMNVGCKALLETVKFRKPRIHLFGHIHEGYGRIEKNGTVFVNASLCDPGYRLSNKPVIVDLSPIPNGEVL